MNPEKEQTEPPSLIDCCQELTRINGVRLRIQKRIDGLERGRGHKAERRRKIEEMQRELYQVREETEYAMLELLEASGLIDAEWALVDGVREARLREAIQKLL